MKTIFSPCRFVKLLDIEIPLKAFYTVLSSVSMKMSIFYILFKKGKADEELK